jgi:hypothetical protein
LFEEIDKELKVKAHFFLIGGAMMLYHGLKPATKDIDVIVEDEYKDVLRALLRIGFNAKKLSFEYKKFDLSQILIREDFRIDLFQRKVCNGFSLSSSMKKRAKEAAKFSKLTVSLCSVEDVFLFKTMTEREGDIEDCIALARKGVDWNAILNELKKQITGRPVWITYVGERLDLLVERGLVIPIMKEVDKMRIDFFEKMNV